MKFDKITALLLNELWGTVHQGTEYQGGNPVNVNPTKRRDTNIYKPVNIKVGQTAKGEVGIAGTKEEMAIEEAGMTAARAILLFATALKSDPIIKNYINKIINDKSNLTPEEIARLHELERVRKQWRHSDVGMYDGFTVKNDFIEFTNLMRKKNQKGLSEEDRVELENLKSTIKQICFAIKDKDGNVDTNAPGCVSATQSQRKKIAEIESRAGKSIDKDEITRIKGLIKRRLDTISSKDLKPQLDDMVEYIFDFIADDPGALEDLDLPKFMLGNDQGDPGEPKPNSTPTGPKISPTGGGSTKEEPSIKTILKDSLPQIKEFAIKLLNKIPTMLTTGSKAIASLPDKIKTAAASKTQNLLKNVNSNNVIELVFSGQKDGVPVYAPSQADEELVSTFKEYYNLFKKKNPPGHTSGF